MLASPDEIKNMSEQERHEYIVKSVIEQVNKSSDFDYVKNNYVSFAGFDKRCNDAITRKLLFLCLDAGILNPQKCKEVTELLGRNSYWTSFLSKIFHGFEQSYVESFSSSSVASQLIAINSSMNEYFQSVKRNYELKCLYPVFVDLFPNHKAQIEDAMFKLCFSGRDINEVEAEEFIMLFGKEDSRSQRILRTYLWKNVLALLIWISIEVIVVLVMLKTQTWWVIALLSPIGLSVLATCGQYFMHTIYSIINFFKEKDFDFDSTILIYKKNKDGTGSFKRP